VGEDEMIVVPHGDGALGGQVWRVVFTHGCDEGETLLVDDPLHVVGEDAHDALLSPRQPVCGSPWFARPHPPKPPTRKAHELVLAGMESSSPFTLRTIRRASRL